MLKSKEGEEHCSYWKQQLTGTLPTLELPIDHPRPSIQSFKGRVYTSLLSPELSKQVKIFAQSQQINVSVVFMGIFKVLLHIYTGQDDIIVGMPTMGRPQERFESLIGFFINMIPVRSQVVDTQSFLKFIRILQFTLVDGMDHAMYPFPAIVRELNVPRTPAYQPVFQAVFAYQNFMVPTKLKDLQIRYKNAFMIDFIEGIHQEGEYEFGLEVYEQDDGYVLNMKYDPDLFDFSTIERMMGHYINLSREVVRNPDLTLREYSVLSDEEKKTVLLDWNATQADYPKDKCMHELFEQQARLTPNATAIIYEGKSLNYRDLDQRSTLLAIYLQEQGIGPDCLVGICVERSVELMVGIFGILKAGGAYVPLDPDYPVERLEYMIQDSKVSLILTQSQLMDKISQLIVNNTKTIYLDRDCELLEKGAIEQKTLLREVKPEHLAYVIYTSGSTGRPKGVMISHLGLTNLLISMGKKPGLISQDKMLSLAPYGFDMVVPELYLPLINGAQCYICSSEKAKDPDKLKQEIQKIKPTIMQATPSTCKMLFHTGWKNEEQIKILCGAEAIPETFKQLFADNNCDVWNMYGPTEATVWSIIQHIDKDEPITIGKPIANTQVYILNNYLNPTPIGVPGELCIAGDGLARGYLYLPDLTAEKFIDNPFNPGTKLYRTGDLARWLPNGEIEFLGRNDCQVKVRGFRIELGEIENQLRTHPKIRDCVAIVKEQDGNKQLICYYATKDLAPIDSQQLRDDLMAKLPDYMIPALFSHLDQMPLTPNGKINRKDLINRKIEITRVKEACVPQSEIEEKVLEIWKDVLNVDELSTDDGFFAVGGDSILAVIVAERIKKNLECNFSVTLLFKYSSIQEISKYISETKDHVSKFSVVSKDSRIFDDSNKKEICNIKTFQKVLYPEYYQNSLAIIGISCNFPGGKNYFEFWNNLKEGKESIRFFSKEELYALGLPKEIIQDPNYVSVQSTIEEKEFFDPGFFNISPRDAEFMDPQLRLLLIHSWKALEDAGYVSKQIPETSVFMSASNSSYQVMLLNNSSHAIKILKSPDEYVSWILAQGGTIPTMISYKLGLKGASFFVHSNCSSSLVGLYLAYQSLISGEAKYALVGASTIFPSSNFGYVHQLGLNFSSNGHVKAFDASADGMIGGEGVAVIALKKALDAIEDGDHIYALLRGISVNNDGSDKVGFYAPSIKGQAEVIKKVLETTKINPESISYVEAHGTGTKLGDPIEFVALNDVYRQYTIKKQFCGIGSVKTNIGHLDTAAGLAGCIKVALSLYYNEVPQSINYKKPNPNIDLENSPFYVLDKPRKLELTSFPHRAALSSLGIGGTNAHAIFEQYKITEASKHVNAASDNNNISYIIPLSARNDNRLKAYAQVLLEFLKNNTEHYDNLADIAYTLQVGREAMKNRVVFIANNINELNQKLKDFIDGKEKIEGCLQGEEKQSKDIVQLYEKDEDHKELVHKWITKGKVKKLAELWVKGFHIDWELIYYDSKPRRISLPTYPFAKERYWIPEADAISTASLAAASAPAAFTHPLLHRNTSDLAEQRFTSTFTGQEFFLADHVVNGQHILPGVAYLEMARAAVQHAAGALTEETTRIKLKNIVWARPIAVGDHPVQVHIGLYPEDTGEIAFEIYSDPEDGTGPIAHSQGVALLITAEEAPTLDLSTLQSECSQTTLPPDQCYEAFHSMGIDYGPAHRGLEQIHVGQGQVLARLSLPSSVTNTRDQFVLHPSLLDAALQAAIGLTLNNAQTLPSNSSTSHKPALPFAVQELEIFSNCTPAMWALVRYSAGSQAGDRVQKLDIDLCDDRGTVCVRMKGFTSRVLEGELQTGNLPDALPLGTTIEPLVGTTMLTPVWDAVPVEKGLTSPTPTDRVVIVGGDKDDRGTIWQRHPQAQALDIQPSDTIEVISHKLTAHGSIDHIMWIAPDHPLASLTDDALIQGQNRDVLQVFRTIKALLRLGYDAKDLGWTIITTQAQSIHKNDPVNPTHASLYGLVGSMAKEYPNWKVRLIDMQADHPWLLDDIFTLPPDPQGDAWAYRDQKWHRQQLIPVQSSPQNQTLYRPQGVYVVIGGAGGIGEAWSEYMIRTYQAQIIWIGRRQKDKTIEAKLNRLAALGTSPHYITADATDRDALQQAYEEIRERYSQINGVIHSAIVLLDQSLANMEEERFRAGLSAKVDVSARLAQVFQKETLDFVLFFSSMISFTKDPGQSNYASGCTFKDAFAHQLSLEWPCAVKVMNWGYWGSVGIVASRAYQDRMAQAGVGSIEPPEAMDALEKLLAGPVCQVALMKTTKPLAMERVNPEELIALYPESIHSNIQNIRHQIPEQDPQIQLLKTETNLRMQGMDELLCRLLFGQLQSLGLFTEKNTATTDLKTKAGLRDLYDRWLAESMAVLTRNNYLSYDKEAYTVTDPAPIDIDALWREWDIRKRSWLEDPGTKAQVTLIEATLRALPDILTGKRLATDIMFPNSSMELVEGIYKNNPVADYFNDLLADTLIAYIEARLKQDPTAQLRIIEIGAGTGGTSATVFKKLKPYRNRIQEYCYTDISKAFLLHAEKEYGPDNPYLTCQIFNVEAPLTGQNIHAGGYDLAIATNVLHATRNIRQTLRNAKAALKKNGLLLLNELSGNTLFSHLTFGLLEGWWLYEDATLRIPGCPGLSSQAWQAVLEDEGFRSILFPAQEAHELGQQIIVAESDGVVRQKQPRQGLAPMKRTPLPERRRRNPPGKNPLQDRQGRSPATCSGREARPISRN